MAEVFGWIIVGLLVAIPVGAVLSVLTFVVGSIFEAIMGIRASMENDKKSSKKF